MNQNRKPLYQEISSVLSAIENCRKAENTEWLEKWECKLEAIEKNVLPHGSGFDCGCRINREKSNPEKLVIHFEFHHMDENGMYCGWNCYTVTVRPSLQFGADIAIRGTKSNNRSMQRNAMDYFQDVFSELLHSTDYKLDC